MSMRGTARAADVSLNTVAKLLFDAGNAAAAHHHERVQGLKGERTVECDEIWSYIYAKQRNLADVRGDPPLEGNVWTWTALDRESKLIVSYLLSGGRDSDSAIQFMVDLSRRLKEPPLLVTDALPSYNEAVQWVYGSNAQHAQHKSGGTSHVERQNLTMRMGMRRFIRRTNGFSKRLEKHAAQIALWFHYYNFVRPHGSLHDCTPAMVAGLERRPRSLRNLVRIVNHLAPKPNRPRKTEERD
jgi:IS1 family transposase